ncbi:polysaccharide biosynthesis C-terminal domain-containing protein [Campylobacter sp. 2018MI35]|uniref:MATE family efflux transporter n=1 Tax=Campylobacter molothri TaxID=1032242 RepID=UPI0019063F34|nr:MATE family efflux transporter [Campylobacter sp. 2018MI35]MBZ7931645.1 polysaccharide biosynthesis C-terminal domain-containing protein [Campylobacter sp. RM12910]MBZ7933048.1 polysaccharide biosynthesis C-terminal domain-containing protein [Campylobacter sp. RM10543]MBZ7934632.1 polysaccharide biosynthesis C-terminal domain-containing protein [Campylobacter sp. W0065]MBZ7966719.1 polysaccharide biosynthesis C-terminal domain-containing protein [Campylobacter sp. RM9756]MBK2000280.1 polysa
MFKSKITKLFFNYALPNMINSGFFSLYIIINGAFVGQFLGTKSLAAMGLSMPFIFILFTLSDLIAIGSSVQISLKIGAKKQNLAREIFSFCIIFILLTYLIIGVLGYFSSTFILSLFSNDLELVKLSSQYIKIFMIFAPLLCLSFAMDNYLRACGKNKYSMYMGIGSVIVNIILDYLFIVYFDLEIIGAAMATSISLSIGSFIGILPFLDKKLQLYFVKPKMNFKLLKNILLNGSSESLMNVSLSLIGIITNYVLLLNGGEIAVAIFSAILYLDSIIMALVNAMYDGVMPLLSFNIGSKSINKNKILLKTMAFYGCIFSCVIFIVNILFSKELMQIFNHEKQFLQLAHLALILYSFNYLFAWLNSLTATYLTAANKVKESLFFSIIQSFFMPIICLLIFTFLFNFYGIFISCVVSEFLSIFLAYFLLKRCFKS